MKNLKPKLFSHLCLLLLTFCLQPVKGNERTHNQIVDSLAYYNRIYTVVDLLKEIIDQDFKDWNEIIKSSLIDFRGNKIKLDDHGNQYLEGELELANESHPRHTRHCIIKFIGKQNQKINRVIISHDYKRNVGSPLIDFIMTNLSFEKRLPVRTIFSYEVERLMGHAYIEEMPDLNFSMSKHHPLRDKDDLISYIGISIK